jgi:hypothetical protein
MKVTLDTTLFLERSIRKFEKLLDVYELRLSNEHRKLLRVAPT